MCTNAEMRKPEDHPGVVRKHFEWQQRNKEDIKKWKSLQRKLEPRDPTISNIERLRREQ